MIVLNIPPPAQSPNDELVTEGLYDLIRRRVDDKMHIANSGTLYMRRVILGRMLARYEAFKMVEQLPGSIVELGVFKGESLLFFAKLVELMNMHDRACTVIGFDNFSGFPELDPKDGKEDLRIDKKVGGWSSENYYEDLQQLLKIFNHDRMAGHKQRIELIEGEITQTVPAYIQENPGLKIKLLHLDCDLYKPTLTGLKYLYDKVVKGGVILLDEYGLSEFPGETAAVDEFFAENMPVIRKFPYYTTPGGYIIKS